MRLGWVELLIILGIALLIFGPRRLSGLGRSLGEAIREFQRAVRHRSNHHDEPKENP